MNPQIKGIFMDLERWARANKYTPTLDEREMIQRCSRRVDRYGAVGAISLGGLTAALLRYARTKLPINGWQQVAWTCCSASIGFYFGMRTAGPPCLQQLVSLSSSPLASEARRLILQQGSAFPNAASYVQLFPRNEILEEMQSSGIHLNTSSNSKDAPESVNTSSLFESKVPETAQERREAAIAAAKSNRGA